MLNTKFFDMKHLRLLSWLLCCAVLMFSIASCEEKEPDLTKKEIDSRLLGTWKQINTNSSESKQLIFMSNGNIIGYDFQKGGKKRVFLHRKQLPFICLYKGLGFETIQLDIRTLL